MEEIKSNVALLLEGKPYEEMHEFCDFSLEEQNEVQVSKGVQPSAPADFKPVIKKSVTYIVAAVLINDQGEVLMMQVFEMFSFCRKNCKFSMNFEMPSLLTRTL